MPQGEGSVRHSPSKIYLSAGEVMAVGQVGRPSVQVTTGGKTLELDVVGRRLGIVLGGHGSLIASRHGDVLVKLCQEALVL